MIAFGPFKDGEPHPLREALPAEPRELLVAAAFASEAGVRALAELMPLGEAGLRKRWLIGLENGLTQPEALKALAELDDSEVRVPYGREIVASSSLSGKKFFHPKIYAVAAADRLVLVSASGNLTRGGLVENVEQFLAWEGDPRDPLALGFAKWWKRAWGAADPVDADFIASYEKVRPKLRPRKRPGDEESGPLVEVEPSPSDLASAEWLWVEAIRPLEGGANNQFELILTAHHFFYPDEEEPPRDKKRSLVLVDNTGTEFTNPDRVIHWNGPPLMPKGNSMWRIRLPTEAEGLSGYQGGNVVIRFHRTATPDRYDIEFAPIGSPEAEAWEREAAKIAEKPGKRPRRMGWR